MMFDAKIYISLRESVSDPEGQTIYKSLKRMGFQSVSKIRTGKLIHLTLEEDSADTAKQAITTMCEKLLTNPIIEDYQLELTKSTIQ
tara:strand:+ start:377 stop:637 length:261 start_codon:yes stop_codon:yes gene_type:complete